MFRKLLMILLAGVFMLSACAAPATPNLPDSGEGQVTEDPDAPVSSTDDPGDVNQQPDYAPVPEDESLSRGEVEISMADLLVLESFPPQFVLHLTGLIQNPCAELRIVTGDPDAQNDILVDVYSVYDPAVMCAQAQEQFEVNLPLGSFPEGQYRVLVNGDVAGEFISPEGSVENITPATTEVEVGDLVTEGEVNMIESTANVESFEFISRESLPVQYALHVVGTLPTPCHKLKTEVSEPDAENNIHVRVYSLVDPEIMCTQVIEPFEEMIELGSYAEGSFTVFLNGKEIAAIP